MRRYRLPSAVGLAALATPALAHVGDHGETGLAHHLAEHGIAAGLVALALIAGVAFLIAKRKG